VSDKHNAFYKIYKRKCKKNNFFFSL
jgi:hypothetical protein